MDADGFGPLRGQFVWMQRSRTHLRAVAVRRRGFLSASICVHLRSNNLGPSVVPIRLPLRRAGFIRGCPRRPHRGPPFGGLGGSGSLLVGQRSRTIPERQGICFLFASSTRGNNSISCPNK